MQDQAIQDNASAPPGTITLGGRVFLVPQPTDTDLMAVRKYLQKHCADPLTMYSEAIRNPRWKTLPKKVRDELAREAGSLVLKKQKSLTPEVANDMLMEAPHCRFFAWILLKKADPALTLEDLTELITEDNAAGTYFTLTKESGMVSLGE